MRKKRGATTGGVFFGRNAKNVLGYHFDGKRHEEDDDVWRQTWVDVMTRTARRRRPGEPKEDDRTDATEKEKSGGRSERLQKEREKGAAIDAERERNVGVRAIEKEARRRTREFPRE